MDYQQHCSGINDQGNSPSSKIPRIYAEANNKEGRIADYLFQDVGESTGMWSLEVLINGKQDYIFCFCKPYIQRWTTLEEETYRRTWRIMRLSQSDHCIVYWLEKRQKINCTYKILANFSHTESWSQEAPFRVNFFAWSADLRRIKIINKFNTKGLDLLNECYFGKNSEEPADYIMVQCHIVKRIWDCFLSSF